MTEEGRQNYIFADPLTAIYQAALSMCVRKKCWLKDLRDVSVDELYEQARLIMEADANG